MNIVYVCREYVGSARSGGIGSYIHEIAKAMVALGHSVTVVTASDDTRKETDTVSPEGIRIISLKGGDFYVYGAEPGSKLTKLRAIYRFYSYRRRLAQVLKKLGDIDIVEVADYGSEALYFDGLDVPVVLRLHTPQSLDLNRLTIVKPAAWKLHKWIPISAERKIFGRARYISGCSRAILDWVSRNFDIHPAIGSVIHNPVSLTTGAKIGSGSPVDKYTIFCAGTICATKGVGDLMEACRILRSEGIPVSVRFAGKGGSYQSALEAGLTSGERTWVTFLGRLSRQEVLNEYRSAAICCFPSWWENMPMVCLEAMAAGAIVVSTGIGGTSEIIQDGVNGFLTLRKDPKLLANTLRKAIELDDQSKIRIAAAAIDTISNKFSVDIITGQMVSFFETVVEDYRTNKQ